MTGVTKLSVLYCITCTLLVQIAVSQQSGPQRLCLNLPPSVKKCLQSYQGKSITQRAVQIECLQHMLWNAVPPDTLSSREYVILRQFSGITDGNVTRSPSGYRVRSEYRTLSKVERELFHRALNRLYQVGIIQTFARVFSNAAEFHLGGPSFLPWNRVFLAMFEEALRKVNPSVSLPYWDSTMDHDMGNPVNSVLWTAEYFGNGVGDVKTGPAAGWVTNQGNLRRDYGRTSRLLSKDTITDILTRCNLKDISGSSVIAASRYNFERAQGGPHVWVGGDMRYKKSAAYDPVFYMHHAYIDYVWELFRRRQARECGVNPLTDYPDVPRNSSHYLSSTMVGFPWFTNRAGVASYWTEYWYSYRPTPACPNCCPNCNTINNKKSPLYCSRSRGVCVASSRRDISAMVQKLTGGNVSVNAIDIAQVLDPDEMVAVNAPPLPRNRGQEFESPPSDRRYLASVLSDSDDTETLYSLTGNKSVAGFDIVIPSLFRHLGSVTRQGMIPRNRGPAFVPRQRGQAINRP